MKELYRFRQFLTEGVTADEIASRVRKLGKEKGIEDKYIEDYIDELDGNFEPDAYENSTDKDLLDDLKSYIDLSEGVIKEEDVFRDKKGSFRNQYSIGNASDIYDDFETYYERWEDEFVEGNSFDFDDEDEWNETNTPGDKVASHSWEISYEEEDDYYEPIINNMLNYLKKNKIYKYKNDDGIDAEFTFDDRSDSIDMVIYYTADDIEKYKN